MTSVIHFNFIHINHLTQETSFKRHLIWFLYKSRHLDMVFVNLTSFDRLIAI